MKLPTNRTKIVCTIGPASDSPKMIKEMIDAGMNIARLNFSHGNFDGHAEVIKKIRNASKDAGRRVAILADLPGPKMRIGEFGKEPIHLQYGDTFTLTSNNIIGDQQRVSMTLKRLSKVVAPGDILFLNDGLIQLKVLESKDNDVICQVEVGGELRSRKGLNLPGIDLGESAFTPHDYDCMKFAIENGVDCISQSFVNDAADIEAVRKAATDLGYDPFIIAKIERKKNRENIDSILEVTDGIMVARGDLGVEIPIEDIAVAQKIIIAKANIAGKPVITATQMLESMTQNRRPTRAESTDVANAILDGTDCVMLSGQSAMGQYPLESVKMLAKIAAATEPYRSVGHLHRLRNYLREKPRSGMMRLISRSVEKAVEETSAQSVLVPSASGLTARNITRYRLQSWIYAVSPSEKTCQDLLFSYGIFPILHEEHPHSWSNFAQEMVTRYSIEGNYMVVTEGPSPAHPQTNHRMEIIDINN